MADTKRQQTKESESQVNTRQDRNTFITDGGTWTWDQGPGDLTWSATVNIQRAGVTVDTVGTGSLSGITGTGQTVWVKVSRTAGAALSFATGVLLPDVANSTDTRIVIGARGADGKFYFRNGTVMSDGDSKLFGMLNTATDRLDVVADGNALYNDINDGLFSYVQAVNQLAVYVGGILQTITTDYVETSTLSVTFQPGSIPTAGELISFVNIIGGQGPAATGTVSLQDAWSVGDTIDVTSGNPLRVNRTTDGTAYVARYNGVDSANIRATRGDFLAGMNTGEGSFGFFTNDMSGDSWLLGPMDDGGKDAIFAGGSGVKGFRVRDNGQIECGSYSGSYPGGSWVPFTGTNGGLRWSVYVGTLNGGAKTDIATGLSDILGVVFTVLDTVTGLSICQDVAAGGTAAKRYGISFDPALGNVTIAGFIDGSGIPGADVIASAYRLVVFHQG